MCYKSWNSLNLVVLACWQCNLQEIKFVLSIILVCNVILALFCKQNYIFAFMRFSKSGIVDIFLVQINSKQPRRGASFRKFCNKNYHLSPKFGLDSIATPGNSADFVKTFFYSRALQDVKILLVFTCIQMKVEIFVSLTPYTTV